MLVLDGWWQHIQIMDDPKFKGAIVWLWRENESFSLLFFPFMTPSKISLHLRVHLGMKHQL